MPDRTSEELNHYKRHSLAPGRRVRRKDRKKPRVALPCCRDLS